MEDEELIQELRLNHWEEAADRLEALRAERDAEKWRVDNWRKCFEQQQERAKKAEARAAPPPEPSEAWQPIETVPKNCWVLAWRAHATTPSILKWDAQYDAFENQQGDHVYGLTHWMPLPQPPAIAALRATKGGAR